MEEIQKLNPQDQVKLQKLQPTETKVQRLLQDIPHTSLSLILLCRLCNKLFFDPIQCVSCKVIACKSCQSFDNTNCLSCKAKSESYPPQNAFLNILNNIEIKNCPLCSETDKITYQNLVQHLKSDCYKLNLQCEHCSNEFVRYQSQEAFDKMQEEIKRLTLQNVSLQNQVKVLKETNWDQIEEHLKESEAIKKKHKEELEEYQSEVGEIQRKFYLMKIKELIEVHKDDMLHGSFHRAYNNLKKYGGLIVHSRDLIDTNGIGKGLYQKIIDYVEDEKELIKGFRIDISKHITASLKDIELSLHNVPPQDLQIPLLCKICNNLLFIPLQCSLCQTLVCKSCQDSTDNCITCKQNTTFMPPSDQFIQFLNSIPIKNCPQCLQENIQTYSQLVEHFRIECRETFLSYQQCQVPYSRKRLENHLPKCLEIEHICMKCESIVKLKDHKHHSCLNCLLQINKEMKEIIKHQEEVIEELKKNQRIKFSKEQVLMKIKELQMHYKQNGKSSNENRMKGVYTSLECHVEELGDGLGGLIRVKGVRRPTFHLIYSYIMDNKILF